NISRNWGVEGDTADPAIIDVRFRAMRNFIATLAFSQGVPMISHGDEIARTQQGNNNAYCQDNETSWFDWSLDERQERLLAFTRRVIALRRAHPVFRRDEFLAGREAMGSGLPDVWWFRPDGRRMTRRDWQNGEARALGVFLNGEEIGRKTPEGERVLDDSFLLLLNAHHEPVTFTLPPRRFGARWAVELSTVEPERRDEGPSAAARDRAPVDARSLVLLRRA
ncbi:MAG TPA: hypothetical protein VHF23_04335, partial [Gaiellaceae bacterium]|nr:hypothetical protein [Gaiellaceae bacterium]